MGAVDVTIYMVDNDYPLRLSKELVPPHGRMEVQRRRERKLMDAYKLSQWLKLSERGLPASFNSAVTRLKNMT